MEILTCKCIACGICEDYCPNNAIRPIKNKSGGYATYFINQDLCTDCQQCLDCDCPGEAIVVS